MPLLPRREPFQRVRARSVLKKGGSRAGAAADLLLSAKKNVGTSQKLSRWSVPFWLLSL